jgi:hypothetical protein
VTSCWDDGTKCEDIAASDANGRILVFDKVTKTRIAPHPDYLYFEGSSDVTYLIVKRNKLASTYVFIIEEVMGLNTSMFPPIR